MKLHDYLLVCSYFNENATQITYTNLYKIIIYFIYKIYVY